jgi:di/tricarboxylate transporter
MIPMSTAMQVTGAAERIATALVDVVGNSSPYLLLLGIALLTMVFGQLISNMATAIIVIPIALSAAAELGVSVRPVLMCVAVAAVAAFLTPVATPVNLMVMGRAATGSATTGSSACPCWCCSWSLPSSWSRSSGGSEVWSRMHGRAR